MCFTILTNGWFEWSLAGPKIVFLTIRRNSTSMWVFTLVRLVCLNFVHHFNVYSRFSLSSFPFKTFWSQSLLRFFLRHSNNEIVQLLWKFVFAESLNKNGRKYEIILLWISSFRQITSSGSKNYDLRKTKHQKEMKICVICNVLDAVLWWSFSLTGN